ncbi:adenylyl-sulfate kinase [Paenibacillus tarimensis]|uniref:adenylyl-sulfate kinase n=1 Tax=Paenibacillus tarimensis TaxID=416012 RepID=UPI001F352987|nr:adenylyl-sulfate kinase [Paenibacillus tarimensis]MCF2943985.1 adenylyl-sulfate kinase [Paenibacillus tarimensis]
MQQSGVTVWFTGLSGAGKTTVSTRVYELLHARGKAVERLDGDVVRQGLCQDLGFSKEDRVKNIERVAFVAKLLTKHNVITLAAFISPYQASRSYARSEIGEFLEVYVSAPISTLVERDVKGLYKKALAGEIKGLTGIDDPYEEPENADLVLRTDLMTIEEAASEVIRLLEKRGYLRPLDDKPNQNLGGAYVNTAAVYD